MKYIFAFLVLIGVGALVAYQAVQGPAAPAVVTGPGPNDIVLEDGWGPEDLAGIFGVPLSKRAAIEAQFEGAWTPAEGWQLTVEEAHDKAVVAQFTNSSIGGGFKVICRFGRGHGYKPTDRIKVQGVISDIDSIFIAGVPDHRIILEPVRIVK